MGNRMRRLLPAVVLFLLVFLGGGASVAAAAAPVQSVSAGVTTAANNDDGPTADELNDKFIHSGYLPINRWFMASSEFHSKFGDFIGDQLIEKLQRNVSTSSAMLVGNTFWYASGEVTRAAVEFDVLNPAGEAIDKTAASIGNILFKQPAITGLLLTAFLGVVIVSALRTREQGGIGVAVRRIVGAVVVMAVVIGMSAAAANSTTEAGNFKPGVGSPGWVLKTASDSVSRVAEVPTAVFGTVLQQNGAVFAADESSGTGIFSCGQFLQGLQQRQGAVGGTDIQAITRMMNNLWLVTGVNAWKTAQFGADNDYGSFMYCRLLEMQSSVATPASSQLVTRAGAGLPVAGGNLTGVNPQNSPVFNPLNNNDADASLVAWAACRFKTTTPASGSDFSLAAGWDSVKDPAISTDDCYKWWTAKNGDSLPAGFSFGGSVQDLEKRTNNQQVLNYMKFLHGNDTAPGATVSSVYAVSSFLMLVVFGGVSIIAMFAKIMLLVMAMMLFLILIVSIFRRQPLTEQIGAYGQKALGMLVFSVSTVILLGMIALFTKVLVDIGNAAFGAGTIMGLLWIGASPLLALAAIHQVFKKVLKAPSPLTPAGAFGWGAAGGAMGSALTNGFMGRMARGGQQMAAGAGRKAMSSATSFVTGGRFGGGAPAGRRHMMDGGSRAGALASPNFAGAAGMGLAAGAGAALGSAGVAGLSRAEQKRADKQELKAAQAFMKSNGETDVPGSLFSRMGAGISGAVGSATAKTKAAWSSVDEYLSADADERQELRDARFGTAEERAERQAALKQRWAGNLAAGVNAVRAVPANTANAIRAGAANARDLGQTAGIYAQMVAANPSGAAAAASKSLWNGTKAVGRATQTATNKTANVIRSKPVVTTAKLSVAALAAASGPAGGVGAAVYLTRQASKAKTARNQRNQTALTNYRTHQAEQAAAAAQAAQAADKAQSAAGEAEERTKRSTTFVADATGQETTKK